MVFTGTEPMRFAAVSKARADTVQPATASRAGIVIAGAGRPIARLVPVGSGDSFSTGEGDPGKPADGNAEGPRILGWIALTILCRMTFSIYSSDEAAA